MKGWRPSAWPRLETGSGSFQAGEFLPDIGSIGLSFSLVLGPRAHGRGRMDVGSLFALIGSAADKSDKRRPTVRDLKTAPALHSLAQTAGGTENEDGRTDEQLGQHATPALPRHVKPESASKRKNAGGG